MWLREGRVYVATLIAPHFENTKKSLLTIAHELLPTLDSLRRQGLCCHID